MQQLNGDSAYPHVVTNAIDLGGNQKVPSDVTAYKNALNSLVQNSVQVNNNNQLFDEGTNSRTVSFQPVRNGTNEERLRCVEGVAYFRVLVRTEITGEGGKSYDSDPKVVKVILKNNCWADSRLIPTGMVLPRLVQYGSQGAMAGNMAVVLAPKEASASELAEVGAVYVFEKSNGQWQYSSRFQVSDAQARDTLNSVTLANGRIIVASKYRDGRGTVFVFAKSGGAWSLYQRLTPPSSQANQEFGQALAAEGNTLLVGAPNLNNSGAVYVYEFSQGNYVLKQTLQDAAAAENKGFGMALSVNNGTLLVGAPQALLRESDRAGEVHVFSLSGASWSLARTLQAPTNDRKLGMKFGAAVVVRDGKILIGAPSYATDEKDINKGAAFYYSTANANPVTLKGEAGDQLFGQAVAIANTGLLIGAPYAEARRGQVYYYANEVLSSPKVTRRHYATVSAEQDNFGSFIEVVGSEVLIGARAKSSPNIGGGAAYIHVIK
ncbi:MAG: FG-GAP repeat protein [Bdellovibrio sp.]